MESDILPDQNHHLTHLSK